MNIKQRIKRRTNLLYRLRKKGVQCETKQRIIIYPMGQNPMCIHQVRKLVAEFGFNIQYEMPLGEELKQKAIYLQEQLYLRLRAQARHYKMSTDELVDMILYDWVSSQDKQSKDEE